jgi:SAM-dependent methyltransferase
MTQATRFRSFIFQGRRFRLDEDPAVRAEDLAKRRITLLPEDWEGEPVIFKPESATAGGRHGAAPPERPHPPRLLLERALEAGFDDTWIVAVIDWANRHGLFDSVEEKSEPPAGDPVALLAGLEGAGIEIGACLSPLPVGPRASVRYVDLYPTEVMRRYFPEVIGNALLVTPDVIAPAHRLPFPDSSLDFVLTSHLLEHLGDPLGTLVEWRRVLRPGGFLFLRLPDQRGAFDRARTRTTLAHVIQDFVEPPSAETRRRRDLEHYREWVQCVNGLTDPRQVELWTDMLLQVSYPIHFHGWQPADVREMLEWLGRQGHRFEVLAEHSRADFFEFTFACRAAKP